MSQQVTFRVGRGPQAQSPTPQAVKGNKLTGILFDAFSNFVFWSMSLAAIILTVGVNPFTPK